MAATTFDIDMEKYVAMKREELDLFVIAFVQRLAREIVEATPVISGNLRASWWAELDAPPPPRGGGGGIAQLSAVAAGMAVGRTYYALNGAAYAMRVEYGFVGQDSAGRTYNQQPRAFVRGTMARAQQIADAVALEIFSK